jgi:hypothetical protein
MKKKNDQTLEKIFQRPIPANIKWSEVVALFVDLGATINEREGSRVSVKLFGVIRVFHRPHPRPDMDKGAIASIRIWLKENGISPKK